MRHILNILAIILLIGAFLYPLFFRGTGRPVVWWLVALMAIAGIACIYILFRFRNEL